MAERMLAGDIKARLLLTLLLGYGAPISINACLQFFVETRVAWHGTHRCYIDNPIQFILPLTTRCSLLLAHLPVIQYRLLSFVPECCVRCCLTAAASSRWYCG